ncbi:uncharacterized protein LOC118437860 isoform X2 [Folsomia candida]|uniref:uncharacterized protein LOC118437860 isoform X2 n=1 Tax=Folsomia candida TaxID=158441 RepID=UPI0016051B2F|nr:uncharacterized protein LOC118437860 isoform X2 [Folsomia candida]
MKWCSTFDGRLAKWVNVKTSFNPANRRSHEKSDPVTPNLSRLCELFNTNIQILKVDVAHEITVTSIHHVLRQNLCPNLKKLLIFWTKRMLFRDREDDFTTERPVLSAALNPRPTLTSFVFWHQQVTPFFTNLIHLVVNASQNLKQIALPWGVFPDFANSKSLTSLTINMCWLRVNHINRADIGAELSRMIRQVGDQLVTLKFSNFFKLRIRGGSYDENELNIMGFRLPRRMSKLQEFENPITEIIQCDELFQNIEAMPALETLVMGKIITRLRSLDTILQTICNGNTVLASVRFLELSGVHDPKVLDRLTNAFPSVEKLSVEILWCRSTCHRRRFTCGTIQPVLNRVGVDLGGVLTTCSGWRSLPTCDQEVGTIIQALLEGRELYAWLKTIYVATCGGNFPHRDFTQDELDLWKQLHVAMAGMDSVYVSNLCLTKNTRETMKDFMTSNGITCRSFIHLYM